MKTLLSLLLVALAAGCTSQAPEDPPMAMGRAITEFGDFTPSEVATIRSGVLKLTFPAPAGSVVRLLPRSLPEVSVSFSDYAPDQEKKGRMGGNVVEYWLNREFVLRVASAYYARGEEHFTMEEWAVVLSRKERESFSRAIYPGDFVEKI